MSDDLVASGPAAAGTEATAPPARGIVRLLTGATALQAFTAIVSLLQILVMARLMRPDDFDPFSVWVTANGVVLGMVQAVGAERVLVGRRDPAAGLASAGVLAVVAGTVLGVLSIALGQPALVLASLAIVPVAVWDYLRIVEGLPQPLPFLKRDVCVAASQFLLVTVAGLAGVPGVLLPLVFWGVAAVLVTGLLLRRLAGVLRPRLGLRTLLADRTQAAPLLLDGLLSGFPLVAGLAVVQARGVVGEATDARLALTILGPVTVLGLAGRRVIFSARRDGPFTGQMRLVILVSTLAVLVGCAGLLALTHTPLYGLVLPGLGGLAWAAIAAFALNHALTWFAFAPTAVASAEGRAGLMGWARGLGTIVAAGFMLLAPFDTAAQVALCMVSATLAYLLFLLLAVGGRRSDTPAAAVGLNTP